MGENTLNKLILAFVTIILGIALLSQVAISGTGVTKLTSETQTIDTSSARLEDGSINSSVRFTPTRVAEALASPWRTQTTECAASTIIYDTTTNASGSVYTDPTDIVRNDAGYFYLVNTAKVNGSTDVALQTISYCPDGYLTTSWGRNAVNYAIGFFALALLGVGIALFYSLGKDLGVFGS